MKNAMQNRLMVKAGFTLLEMMMAVSIVAIVVGVLSSMSIGLGDTASIQDIKGESGYQARRGLIYLTRDLRSAAMSSLAGAPGATISYRVAQDTDGNGTAVDVGGDIELSDLITVGRDVNDANNDGIRQTQLIRVAGNDSFVLANGLLPNEDTNNNGVLDAGEDVNGNGVLDRGVWFGRNGNVIQISIQTGAPTRRGRVISFNINESVRPRN